LKITNQVTNNL